MLDVQGVVLYVGKVWNLKVWVLNYVCGSGYLGWIVWMICEICLMMFLIMCMEIEVLFLEQNLIKQLKLCYNVLLWDDKSFLNILVVKLYFFVQIKKYCGVKLEKGDYYGFFVSVGVVNWMLNQLQWVFLLCLCMDFIFFSWMWFCLLFQIKWCSVFCVGWIEQVDYNVLVGDVEWFL